MMPGDDLLVVLAGARGAAGRMHERIHRSLGNTVVAFDASGPPPSARHLRLVAWDEAIMDICTPTAYHAQSMAWGYARGIRRFLVEKPAAVSLAEWQTLLSGMPDTQTFAMHPYIYSKSFQAATQAVSTVVGMSATFDKNRESDDLIGRGAGPDGRLAHLFQIEAPHQFAMALAALPGLQVVSAEVHRRGARGAEPDAPIAGRATLRDSRARARSDVAEVQLDTDLRSPRRRELRLRGHDGAEALVRFATTPDLVGRVWVRDRGGRWRLVFEERDDLLRNTIVIAVESFRRGEVPHEGSAGFTAAVLGSIDDAIALTSDPPAGSQRLTVVQAAS
jgi:predicted dehydrogenase